MTLFVRRSILALALVTTAACGDDGNGPRGPLALAITSAPDSLLRSERPRVVGGVVDADGNAVRGQSLTYRSLDEDVLEVDARGYITPTGLGTTRVIVAGGGLEDTTDAITVYATYRAEIEADEPLSVSVEESATLAASMLDDLDEEVGGRTFAWSSSDPSAVSVTSGGVVTGTGAGDAWIRVQAEAPDGTITRDSIEVRGTIAYRAIYGGAGTFCGISMQREAFCWGDNSVGQLGTGDRESSLRPKRVAGGLRWASLAPGSGHTCGIVYEPDGDGPAYCWGGNDAGSVGNGQTSGVFPSPQPVVGGLQFVELGTGFTNSCGRTASGEIHCWGRGHHGQIGDGSLRMNNPAPVRAAPGLTFERMGVGTHHAVCGVQAGGLTWCWGHNDSYQVARAPLLDDQPVVDTIQGGVRLQQVQVGHFHGCGLLGDGRAACWGGRFNSTSVGDTASTFAGRPAAEPIDSDLRFTQLSGRFDDTCGLAADGRVHCWGGSLARSASPITNNDGVRFATIHVGHGIAVGLGIDGRAYYVSGDGGRLVVTPVAHQD